MVGTCSSIMQVDDQSHYSSISEKCGCQQKVWNWLTCNISRQRKAFVPADHKRSFRKLPGRNCVSEQAHWWKSLPSWVPGVSLYIITAVLQVLKCTLLDKFGGFERQNQIIFSVNRISVNCYLVFSALGWALEILVENSCGFTHFLILEVLFRTAIFIACSA